MTCSLDSQKSTVPYKSRTAALFVQIFYLFHYPILHSHAKEWRLYDTLRKEFHWPYRANDVCTTVPDFPSCATQGTWRCHEMELRMFRQSCPLEFVA